MKILKVYTDFTADMELLGDAERGRLFTAMLEYASTGEAPDLKGNERFLWGTVKKNIDSQRESYSTMCDTNKRIATERNAPSRSVNKNHGALQEQEQEQDKEQEHEQDSIPPKPPQKKPKDDAFDTFWAAYPNKKAKEDARKAFAKALKLTTLDRMLQAIEEQKNTRQWNEDGGKYIPYPATWLNRGDYANVVTQESIPHRLQAFVPTTF